MVAMFLQLVAEAAAKVAVGVFTIGGLILLIVAAWMLARDGE